MTDHAAAQDHLDLLARDVASPVPAGLLDTARGARRRRARGRLAVGTAVATVAVVALAVTLPGRTATPRPDVPVAAPTATTATGPVAPEGTRWVSQDGWMVAVPGEWVRTKTFCSAVRDEGPGFYYLETDRLQCLPPEASPSVGILPRFATSEPQPLVCRPECTQGFVDVRVQLLFKKFPSADGMTVIRETLRPVPPSWLVDPATGEPAPAPAVVAATPVTGTSAVVGEWRISAVPAGPVPEKIEPELTVSSSEERRLTLSFPVDCNTSWRPVRLGEDGSIGDDGRMMSTYAGCPDTQTASGFGVREATELRLTPDGDLVLVGPDDTTLAVYARA